MAQTLVIEVLKVEAISNKFGNGAIKVGEEWINFNDNTGVPVTDLEKGGTYKFELSISEKGKRYVNKVLLDEPAVGNGAPKPTVRKSFSSSTLDEGKKAYFAAKDESMKIGGLFHDAATIVASVEGNVGDKLKGFEDAIDSLIKLRKKFD